jgi:hypothetical protein
MVNNLVALLVHSHSFGDEFRVNNSKLFEKQFKHYLTFWPVLLRFLISWRWWRFPGGQLSLLLCIVQKTQRFISYYDPVEKCPIFVSTIHQVTASTCAILMLVLCQILWQGPWLIPAAAVTSSNIWEQLSLTNIATSWLLSSVLTILG